MPFFDVSHCRCSIWPSRCSGYISLSLSFWCCFVLDSMAYCDWKQTLASDCKKYLIRNKTNNDGNYTQTRWTFYDFQNLKQSENTHQKKIVDINSQKNEIEEREWERAIREREMRAASKNPGSKRKKHSVLIFNIEIFSSYSTVLTMYIMVDFWKNNKSRIIISNHIECDEISLSLFIVAGTTLDAIWNEKKSNKLLLVWPWFFLVAGDGIWMLYQLYS